MAAAVVSDDRYLGSDLNIRNIGHVEDRPVHRNAANDRRRSSTNYHFTFVRQCPRITVCIPDGNGRDQGVAFGDERAAISERIAGGHML